MSVRLRPARRLHGTIAVPGDKSISHRALILNALADGAAHIDGLLDSDDCRSTMACLRSFGVEFSRDADRVVVRSPGLRALREPDAVLDCGNSGTTMRLLAGLAAAIDGVSVLDGDASLRSRPMARVLGPLSAMGARVDGRAEGTLAPIVIRGGALHPFRGRLEVASAQVKSAIVIAALSADGDSAIEEPATTRDHTERMLSAMGAQIRRAGSTIEVTPADSLQPIDMRVPGDLSAAAFWLVAGSIADDAEIELPGVGVNPTRTGVLDVLTAMGANITRNNERLVGGEPVADLVVRSAQLRGVVIGGDLVTRSIDELPVLAVAAAYADGVTEIRDAAELRVKESDRIATTAAMLKALGARVEEHADGMTIEGGHALVGGTLDSHGDHRLAMAAAVAALSVADGTTELRGEDAVGVSYPQFWKHLDALAGAGAFA